MTTQPIFDADAQWIWSDRATRRFNNFVCFRRTFDIDGDARDAFLRITADSRYEVFVNGEWLGHGPPRSWPSPWTVDQYDVASLLRPRRNVVAVLVQHFGISTFQYLHEEPGLIAQLTLGDGRIVTDSQWRALPNAAFSASVPRISTQQGWEEQFDARREPGDGHSRDINFDDRDWPAAMVSRPSGAPPHESFELREIPMLTREPASPVALLGVEAIEPATPIVSLDLREMTNDVNLTANCVVGRLLVVGAIESDVAQTIEILPHGVIEWKLNGAALKLDKPGLRDVIARARLKLRAGRNVLLGRLAERTFVPEGGLGVRAASPVRFDPRWVALGPFDDTDLRSPANSHDEFAHAIMAPQIDPAATKARFDAIFKRGTPNESDLAAPFARVVAEDRIHPVNVFAACASDRVASDVSVRVDDSHALLHDDPAWTTIHPLPDRDVRLLLDFGREVVGFHEFEIDAPAGMIFDDHNFEAIQRDGRFNFAVGMNNTFRYVCREGVQRYRTFVRRGFRYSYITLSNFKRPARIRFIRTIVSTAPSAGRGNFECSDPMLQQIWHVGAHTVRCCAEDTYTDCPTFEQTYWVGDARNEALVDLISSGDPRVSARCLELAGRSLDRSPIVEALVPSGWQTILPAWTFLWMRWSHEHFMHTGDEALARRLLDFIDRNVQGIESFRNEDGLFDIYAWNMFDWAPMDVPHDGIVTHQNCLAVLGLRQASGMATLLKRRDLASRWTRVADRLSVAINRHLWDDRRRAYVDCIHASGKRSKVFTQQTQTAAYISGVAQDVRAKRCAAIIDNPPRGFVRAGSPFFMFFVLECYARQNRFREMFDLIRHYWGGQIEQGATTFWEEFHPELERQTRSHCHGWSAAPTYFLSQHVLGVQPLTPGYESTRIAPQVANLKWAQGRAPTPRGEIACYWKRDDHGFCLRVDLPPKTKARLEIPFAGKLRVEQGKIRRERSTRGTTIVSTTSPRIALRIS